MFTLIPFLDILLAPSAPTDPNVFSKVKYYFITSSYVGLCRIKMKKLMNQLMVSPNLNCNNLIDCLFVLIYCIISVNQLVKDLAQIIWGK